MVGIGHPDHYVLETIGVTFTESGRVYKCSNGRPTKNKKNKQQQKQVAAPQPARRDQRARRAGQVLHEHWMTHKSDHNPVLTMPGPGLTSRGCNLLRVKGRASISGAVCGVLLNTTLGVRASYTFDTVPGAPFQLYPAYVVTAINADTAMTLTQFTMSGQLTSDEAAHSQFIGAEFKVTPDQKLVDRGGIMYVFDNTNPSMINTSFTHATPTATALTMNQYIVPPGPGGSCDAARPHSFRVHPNPVSHERWFENTENINGNSGNPGDILVDLDNPGSGAACENGYGAGFIIDNADATTQYLVEVTLYYRYQPFPPPLAATSSPTRLPTMIANANPMRTAAISRAAAELRQAARNTGTAITAKPQSEMTPKKLLDTVEKGGAFGAASYGITRVLSKPSPSFFSGVEDAVLPMLEDAVPLAALL